MKLLKKISFVAICLPLLSLTACSMNPIVLSKDTSKNIDNVQARVTTLRNGAAEDMPNLRYTSTTAVLPPARWQSQPQWMNNRVSMRGQNMPFSFWVDKVVTPTGANISYQDAMNQNFSLPFNYTGTVQGALDKLAATTGYDYTVTGNEVNWYEYITKTFDVSFMPGASQYMMGGQTQIAGTTSGSSGSSGGSGGSTAATNISGQLQAGQYSNLQASLSVWTDLQNTIKTMLSKDGKVTVSQATTTITVSDRPENVRLVGDYLASMNKDLSRQVALQVEVLQIHLNKAFSYGVNWNVVTHKISVLGGLASSTSTSLGGNLTSVGGIVPTGLGFGITNSNPKVLIEALSQQGEVTTVTNPRVVTLNNQVAQIGITSQKSYLASSSVTNTANVGTQVSLTPGIVTTGFTLYVLPKIMNHDVFLQLTSELSNLDSLQTFNSATGESTSSSSSSSSSSSNQTTPTTQIQEPTVSSKSFNQRVMVPSGCTLVLSGFRQVTNESNKSAPFSIDAIGARGVQQDNTEILVLITPIIGGDNS
jgi:type IVB pilus formation R64 PilN family outer membrane protein